MHGTSASERGEDWHLPPQARRGGERAPRRSVVVVRRVQGPPRLRKPLVKPDLFPDLEAFVAAEGASFEEAVDAAVRNAVGVAGVVVPGSV